MLKVNDLTFSYRKNSEKVLDGVSFEAQPGRLIALLGANGAGKSTLFRCILGLEKNYSGEILLGGTDLRRMTQKEIASAAAYVPQSETPAFNYTVFDTVLMGTTGTLPAFAVPKEREIAVAEEAVGFLGIGYLAERGINELSGGERQLVMLARAVAQKAKLMLIDEPTANLDYGNQQMVLKNAKKLTEEGYTILFSTHNPEHALQYASHVLVIKDHKIAADGPTDEVLTEALIRDVYGLEVKIVEVPAEGEAVKSCVPVNRAF